MKTLTAYFSRRGMNYAGGKLVDLKVGNTERAAKLASELAGGALFEIRAEHEYPYDYRECVEVSKEELTSGARPELAVEPGDLSGVEAVILCYPCWCGTMPMPVWTFLEGCDLAGKRILPMCTNEGSGMGRSEADIRRLCPEAVVEKGLSVKGSAVESAGPAIEAWLREHGII
ncbi:MAG: flavodoxin [Oscillospiraceae bacterium]|nr:flavodoxin [Oscillospiraceae bacterium]